MNREPAASSAISSFGYDAPTQTLEVEFTSGSVYRYFGVADSLWREFLQADSKGRFLNSEIKTKCSFAKVR